MNYQKMSILDLHNALLNGEITPLELTKIALEKARKDSNNVFEYISEKEALEQVANLDPEKKNNLLWGIPFVIKDNYSTKDIPTTASSNILSGYIPTFSSEVYSRLIDQGAILIGKTTLDELAMGGSGLTGHLGWTYNPWDPTHQRIMGGSSCGSAASCAAGIVPFAIGSDTGDSVRKPASFGGLVGFKPTWGRISRYGLFQFAPSLDHVGFFTRNVTDSAIVLQTLAGKDNKDMTSSSKEVEDYVSAVNSEVKGMSIAVISEIFESVTDDKTKQVFQNILEKLKESGIKINTVHMDINLCKAIYPTYIVISCAEATSSTANLDGVKFGPRYEAKDYEKVMFEARTKGFSELIKRRLVIGSYSLLKENQDEVFLRAQKCRKLIVDEINNILKDNDAIFLPVSPSIPPLFKGNKTDELSDEYLIADNYLAIANFGGQPSLTLPIGINQGFPFGANLTGRIFEESKVLALAKKVEEITGLANLVVEDK